MNELSARLSASLWWLLPLVLLATVIGWEIDWGRAVRIAPPPAEPVEPKPVAAKLLPDYAIAGGVASHAETVNRTLFNPTRRPAPVAVVVADKPRMQKGLYALTGTTVAGDRSLAFLKEVTGGKPRTVKQGDTLNGMLVAEVKPDRVRLTLGDDSEVIVLKVVTNSRPTPQPVAQAPQGAGTPGQPPAGGAPGVAGAPEAAQTLAERRRAARAAEAAAAQAAGASPPPGAPVAAAPAANPSGSPQLRSGPPVESMDPRWRTQMNRQNTKN